MVHDGGCEAESHFLTPSHSLRPPGWHAGTHTLSPGPDGDPRRLRTARHTAPDPWSRPSRPRAGSLSQQLPRRVREPPVRVAWDRPRHAVCAPHRLRVTSLSPLTRRRLPPPWRVWAGTSAAVTSCTCSPPPLKHRGHQPLKQVRRQGAGWVCVNDHPVVGSGHLRDGTRAGLGRDTHTAGPVSPSETFCDSHCHLLPISKSP